MSETGAQELLEAFFAEESIDLYAVLDLADCPVTRGDLLCRTLPGARSVILYAVPYFIGRPEGANLSLYAMAPDYHLYLQGLGARLKNALLPLFPDARFEAFGDHSPIDERISAARAGLGLLGDNGLIITKNYGSFVFIGELLSDLPQKAEPVRKAEKKTAEPSASDGDDEGDLPMVVPPAPLRPPPMAEPL